MPKRLEANLVVVGLVAMTMLLAPCGSGADDTGNVAACVDGTTRGDAGPATIEGSPPETREEAIRAALQHLDREASDAAITAGVVSTVAGADGVETVEIRTTDDVVVTMFLSPQDPGWLVQRSTWCAPVAA
jgi:hypothetical protein